MRFSVRRILCLAVLPIHGKKLSHYFSDTPVNTIVNKQQLLQLQLTSFDCLLSHHQTVHGSMNYTRNYTMWHYRKNSRNRKQLKLKIKKWEKDLKPYKVHTDSIYQK